MQKKFDINQHRLVPNHSKLNKSESKILLEKYNLITQKLPKINKADPAIQHLNVEVGDIIKIERESLTAGVSVYYRVVSDV